MKQDATEKVFKLLEERGYTIGRGLTEQELIRIETAFQAAIPDEYKEFLREGVPSGGEFPDWSNPEQVAQQTWKWIDETFKFDIENNNYWCDEFGDKPSNINQANTKALEIVRSWPPLIQIYSHRFLVSKFGVDGSPVISLYQPTDAIIYGSNIKEYFENEFSNTQSSVSTSPLKHTIPHWGDALNL